MLACSFRLRPSPRVNNIVINEGRDFDLWKGSVLSRGAVANIEAFEEALFSLHIEGLSAVASVVKHYHSNWATSTLGDDGRD
jgi:hypothetical protein